MEEIIKCGIYQVFITTNPKVRWVKKGHGAEKNVRCGIFRANRRVNVPVFTKSFKCNGRSMINKYVEPSTREIIWLSHKDISSYIMQRCLVSDHIITKVKKSNTVEAFSGQHEDRVSTHRYSNQLFSSQIIWFLVPGTYTAHCLTPYGRTI